MTYQRVLIIYPPRLYLDLISRVLELLDHVQVTALSYDEAVGLSEFAEVLEEADVVLLSADRLGSSPDPPAFDLFPKTKFIALSASGDFAFIRHPEQEVWRVLQPFGIYHLICEVTGSQQPLFSYSTGRSTDVRPAGQI